MDIDLLSKMVKELILDNDEVSLPGVGSFVAELVPSSFSDKGYTINPPYKRLSFRKKADASDNVLIDFYAKSNNVDKETASKIVIDFLSEMQKVLELRKSIVFPGLGKLRATKENIFFFVADEDLDIYPEGFGLEPISLKTHEETPAEVSATIAALQDILNPEEISSGSESQSENESQSEAESEQETAPHSESGTEVTGVEQPEAVSSSEDAPEVTRPGSESSREVVGDSDNELESQSPEQPASQPESDEVDYATEPVGSVLSNDLTDQVESSGQVESRELNGPDGPDGSCDQVESDEQVKSDGPVVQIESNKPSDQVESERLVESDEQNYTNEPEQPAEPKASDNVEEVSVADATELSRTEPAKKSRKGWKALIWTAVAIAALAVTFIVGFVILAHIAPDFIDSILYTQEELEIINH